MNVDGSIRDQDLFVLGDDDDDAVELADFDHEMDDNGSSSQAAASTCVTPPPAYPSSSSSALDSEGADPQSSVVPGSRLDPEDSGSTTSTQESAAPPKYYIKRGDTLLGIALRFNINVSPLFFDIKSCSLRPSIVHPNGNILTNTTDSRIMNYVV
jgi:hypothetical protein